MNRIAIIIISLFFIPVSGFSQDDEQLSKKEQRQNRIKYRGLSYGGLGVGNFRDFATSPLTYTGLSFSFGGFKINMDDRRETEWGTPISVGLYGSNFNNHSSQSTVYAIGLYYSELYKLNALSSDKLNVKVGGMINGTLLVRTNPGLLNNGSGLEVIPTLFGSIKGTLDVSRKVDKNKKFLFFRYKRQKRKKSLALRINPGLINASYRNGYVYSGQSAITNNPKAFDDYQLKVFSGFRMSSSLDYTLYSRNTTNAIQFSYVWDAFGTGGDLDKFEMAQHGLKVTLLFDTK